MRGTSVLTEKTFVFYLRYVINLYQIATEMFEEVLNINIVNLDKNNFVLNSNGFFYNKMFESIAFNVKSFEILHSE